MNEILDAIKRDYVDKIEEICQHLLEGLNDSNGTNLKTKVDFFIFRNQVGQMRFVINDVTYNLHGSGCTATSEAVFLDWDFGYRSRWCGVNPWKCAMTFKENNIGNKEYYEGKAILEVCEEAVTKGVMFKKYEQYYFTTPKSEKFVPEFPKEFDSLVIEYNGKSWLLDRNKSIDKFLRKSTLISNKIKEDRNKYILKFLNQGKEVYSIPYNDIDYPENAVKIMSDQVIRNLQD